MEKLQSMDHYNEVINGERVILMFSADWCGDCKFIEPFLPRLEADYPEFTFIHVDRDEFIDLCQELNIFGIPSFVAYHEGKEVGRFVSKDRKTLEEIENFINGLNIE